jgi:multidrug efflux pump
VIARFFIDRPIFASVLSLGVTLVGAVALSRLPLALYPQMTPPTVQVDCKYPGASARVLADAVAAPIEQQVIGVENMMYMSSQCTKGTYNLTITFKPGTDPDLAWVRVQNRVNQALPQLPDVIKQAGVPTRKRSPETLLAIALTSPDDRYDQLYLSNYALIHVKDALARVPGVSDVRMQQRDYSMRIWLDPERLAVLNLTATDVVAALREQNAAVACGQLARRPSLSGQATQVPLTTLGRLTEVEQFEQIIVKRTPERRLVRLKDVARVGLGARSEDVSMRVDRRQAISLTIYALPDANALDTADRVKARMAELAEDFPEGLRYEIRYDTTPFIRASIKGVFKTLQESVVLVAVVVLLFLQNWRSAIIPLLAVPVALIGTFAVMAALGFSLNTLTLFGLVLAVGIVVDDAIVIVEAVELQMARGLPPREATLRAMEEVSGPVVAMLLVLSAVFVPCAFMSGIVGEFFRQFALTIASSTILSAFNSLTLSPALAALLLRPRPHPAAGPIRGVLGRFFSPFNAAFARAAGAYTWAVGGLLRVGVLVVVVYAGLLFLTYRVFTSTPRGFIPEQDMGYLLVEAQLSDAASLERAEEVMVRIEDICHGVKGVRHTQVITGESMSLGTFISNFGSIWVSLDDIAHRDDPELSAGAIANELRARFDRLVPEAKVTVFLPPPVRGVGNAGGFRLMVEDRGSVGPNALQEHTEALMEQAGRLPGLERLSSVFRAGVPQLVMDIDRASARTKGVDPGELKQALEAHFGALYVNDINLFGRTWQVIVQAAPEFRRAPEDILKLKVRNRARRMVPLGALGELREVSGPLILTRYNMYPAAPIRGSAAPGTSTGQALARMERLAREQLPPTLAVEWTEMAYLEKQAGNTAPVVFAFAVVMVFLVLAAQYESWALPLAVILVVPMCVLSATIGVNVAGQDVTLFTQIGLVVLVGLASKNAILIVEFARRKREQGLSRRQATLEACRLRLRPIVMTSLAFVLGVCPLAFSRGAGAEMRQTLGVTVFAGMIGVTLFGLLLTPVFFDLIDRLSTSAPFDAPLLRRIGRVCLSVFALGPVRRLLVGQGWRPVPAPRSPRNAPTPPAPTSR